MVDIAVDTIVGDWDLAKAANTTKADTSPAPMKPLRRARAKAIEPSGIEALQIVQQALAMGIKAGLTISHKPMIGVAKDGMQAPVLIIELWQVGKCHKCNWWTYEGKCHNPSCEEHKPQ